MHIYILRDGQETGPLDEETARAMLVQGDVKPGDMAWRQGLPDWQPLSEVLGPAPLAAAPVAVPEPVVEKAEPATPKQQALLSFLGIAISADLSRDQAARLVNDAMENPQNAARLTQWNEERLRLHPELFAAEIQAKKENRASHYLELCQTAGAEYFSGITKAHCQVLVGFLDVKFPHWGAREAEAAERYFFPAVAEKFPQLVNKTWRGRLQYAEGAKVASKKLGKSPTASLRRSGTSPLAAISRGILLGGLILGGLFLGYRNMQSSTTVVTTTPSEPNAGPVSPPPAVIQDSFANAVPPQNVPAVEPLPSIAPADFTPPPPPIAPAPIPEVAVSPAPMAAPDSPAMPAPANPAPEPTMAMGSSAVNTAPMAALPGTEPPVPVPPPPATMPTPAMLPGLPPEAAAIPPLSPAEISPPPPAPTTAKTNLVLTKPVEVVLAYGKAILPPGTLVKLVSRQGAALKVSYQNNVIIVPASSTDAD